MIMILQVSHFALAALALGFPILCTNYPTMFSNGARSAFFVVFAAIFAAHLYLFHGPISQPLSYHNFADKRALFGGCIPNTYDVLSNIPFFATGAYGIQLLNQPTNALDGLEWWGWFVFSVGVLLVSIGSAYYHWSPNNKTLVWDRLPMTIGFMSLFALMIEERIQISAQLNAQVVSAWIFVILLLLGVFSVVYWDFTDDLRPYVFVQAFPIIAIPILMAIFPAQFAGRGTALMTAVFFYSAAKVTESFDREIFRATGNTVSGHTLKHLLAAWACHIIICRITDNRVS